MQSEREEGGGKKSKVCTENPKLKKRIGKLKFGLV
jgi:hypothetical protein